MIFLFAVPPLAGTVLVILIAAFTLIGIMIRPWKTNEAIIAPNGATLLLVLGLISPMNAASTLLKDWNTLWVFW